MGPNDIEIFDHNTNKHTDHEKMVLLVKPNKRENLTSKTRTTYVFSQLPEKQMRNNLTKTIMANVRVIQEVQRNVRSAWGIRSPYKRSPNVLNLQQLLCNKIILRTCWTCSSSSACTWKNTAVQTCWTCSSSSVCTRKNTTVQTCWTYNSSSVRTRKNTALRSNQSLRRNKIILRT